MAWGDGGRQNCRGGLRYFGKVFRGVEKPFEGGGDIMLDRVGGLFDCCPNYGGFG